MKNHKKLFIILVTMFVAVFLTVSSMIDSNRGITLNSIINQAIADSESGGGGVDYRCNCGLLWGSGCKADNYGKHCAPIGTAKCWIYNGNCS